jgi:hypothetical protein
LLTIFLLLVEPAITYVAGVLCFASNSGTGVLVPQGWDIAHSGLLTGERLQLDLQQLEGRFMETNERTLEVEQSYSLMQFAPEELLKLRQTGECEFAIPEIMFDLAYPGHYRRRIKAVRLTIPYVTGPYANVAATLRLKDSQLRREPKVSADLDQIPPRHRKH